MVVFRSLEAPRGKTKVLIVGAVIVQENVWPRVIVAGRPERPVCHGGSGKWVCSRKMFPSWETKGLIHGAAVQATGDFRELKATPGKGAKFVANREIWVIVFPNSK